jgi:hypothetical protein
VDENLEVNVWVHLVGFRDGLVQSVERFHVIILKKRDAQNGLQVTYYRCEERKKFGELRGDIGAIT